MLLKTIDMASFDELAIKLNTQQSFKYKSFHDAKIKYTDTNSDTEIILDRLTLCIYSHTLSHEFYSALKQKLEKLFVDTHSREDIKEREEYISLLRFVEALGLPYDAEIEKRVQPDFVLTYDDKSIGIEVTSLSAKEDNQLRNIARKYFGKGLNAKGLKESAYQNYKKSSEKFTYCDIEGSASIGRAFFNIGDDKHEFAITIIKKYRKYKDKLENFNDFIVLCDALETFSITDEHDAKDVMDLAVTIEPAIVGFNVVIMYENNNGEIAIYKQIN